MTVQGSHGLKPNSCIILNSISHLIFQIQLYVIFPDRFKIENLEGEWLTNKKRGRAPKEREVANQWVQIEDPHWSY